MSLVYAAGDAPDERTRGHAKLKLSAIRAARAADATKRSTKIDVAGFSVDTSTGGDGRLTWGVASTQGRRPGMEDAHIVVLDVAGSGNRDDSTALFGVFDGHSGREVAAFCAHHATEALLHSHSYQAGSDLEAALVVTFEVLEAMMKEPGSQLELFNLRHGNQPLDAPDPDGRHSSYGCRDATTGAYVGPTAGAAATLALLRGSELYVAGAGDSRCVLCEGGKAIRMTRDHKPSIPEEQERVEQAGLTTYRNRVVVHRSSLAMTRALGDTKYKAQHLPPEQQAVTPIPDTSSILVITSAAPPPTHPSKRGEAGRAAGCTDCGSAGGDVARNAEFVLLACDGVWDCLNSQQAVDLVRGCLGRGQTAQQAAVQLVATCLTGSGSTSASTDNITAMVVDFCGGRAEAMAPTVPMLQA